MQAKRNRAAVLCFGGWGLQTMLHLWPRIRFIQEERQAIGIGRQLPDLNQLTAFAAILPEVVPTDPTTYRPFRLLRPYGEGYPEPFYVEKVVEGINPLEKRADFSQLTYAERIGATLLERALIDQHLEELSPQFPPIFESLPAGVRVSRLKLFESSMSWAEAAARTIVQKVIDSTRLDHVETEDPLVQSTLYVVASLAEPLTSALIWPIVSELVATLGNRNIVNVVAILSTGSFAQDDTRVIEEASSYVALSELEALSGINTRATSYLRDVVEKSGKLGWKQRVGQKRFNRIYLLDREKSNQALARNALELAVLAGNAIESFLVANGESFIESQLGPATTSPTPSVYSLLGAASDYVPLAQYVISAVREEQKRIIREKVLLNGELPHVQASLQELRASPEEAIANLLPPRTRGIFERESARARLVRLIRQTFLPTRAMITQRARQALPAIFDGYHRETPRAAVDHLLPPLQVAHRYILPETIEEDLSETPALWQWRRLAEQQLEKVAHDIQHELETSHFEKAWGLTYDSPSPAQEQIAAHLGPYRHKSWSTRHQNDKRTVPAATFKVVQSAVEDICRQPSGIMMAKARLASWIEEVERVLDEQRQFGLTTDLLWNDRTDRRYRRWERTFFRVAESRPHTSAMLVRIILMAMFIAYLIFSWLLFESGLQLSVRTLVLAALGSGGLTAFFALIPWLGNNWRVSRMQNQLFDLEQDRFSQNTNQMVRSSLHRVYQRLWEELTLVQKTLQEPLDQLEKETKTQDSFQIPPLGIAPTHLRIAHTNDEIWEDIKRLIQQERRADGKTAIACLRDNWQNDGKILRNWQDQGTRLAQRVRLALELPLNERELKSLLELTARQKIIDQANQTPPATPEQLESQLAAQLTQLEQDRRSHAWCGYVSGQPNQNNPTAACTACPNLDRHHCPFSDGGREQRQDWSLVSIVQEYVTDATRHLIPENGLISNRSEFMQEIGQRFAIERLILADLDTNTSANASVYKEKDKSLHFVEHIYARAKPAANYDIIHSLSHQHIEIEFGATLEGEKSLLQRAFAQRRMNLLASYDPMSVSAVRTINGLTLQDLMLVERCNREYQRLHPDDKSSLTLLSGHKAEMLYGKKENEMITYEKIRF